MGVDIAIIPKRLQPITWGELRDSFISAPLSSGAQDLISGDLSLFAIRDEAFVANYEPLKPGRVYKFVTALDSTLDLFLSQAVEDEIGLIEDFSYNLDSDEVKSIKQVWREAGYSYWIETYGGRAKQGESCFVSLQSNFPSYV
jgi:hypothetical protein